jgi:DNA-binding transcriptional MerR regulator
VSDEDLKRLVESNARAIQAMLDARVDERSRDEERMERLQENMERLQGVAERLANLQEGMARMLVSLDEDRPTVLRKLNAIESKLDRILEAQQEGESG